MEHVHGVDIFDIYDIGYEPWWMQSRFFAVSGAVLFVVAACLAYFFYRRHKQSPLTYHQKTVAQLEELSRLIRTGDDAQDFYFKLTAILKLYLSHTFFLSSALTDEEFLAVVKESSDIPQFVAQGVEDIMNGIELVKFGQGTAVAESMERAFVLTKKVIEVTAYRFDR